MLNKRGQADSGGIPLTIVLVIALAILLIVGVVLYNTNATFRSYISNIAGGGGNNIASVITGCETACETGNTYGYCKEVRDVKWPKDANNPNKVLKLSATCEQLAKGSTGVIGHVDNDHELAFSCSKPITC